MAEPAAVAIEELSDGAMLIDARGGVIAANSEAMSLLGIASAEGHLLTDLPAGADGWDALIAAVDNRQGVELPLRVARGRAVLARVRPMEDDSGATFVALRDVDRFEFSRDRAFGRSRDDGVHIFRHERTRPDFATQRLLSPEMARVLARGEMAMRQGARILITGESGVGKSEIARYLHLSVSNARDPFIIVNCASAASHTQLDEALFGTPQNNAPSLVEQAEGGTLFLDEVTELPPQLQARLLWFLEEGRPPAAGGAPRRPAKVRVLSATNRDLRRMVQDGQFRADLYYRLAVVPLRVPALREMQPLVNHLIDRFQQTINQRRSTPVIIPQRLREILCDYSFPGNIRELSNIVQRIAVFIEHSENFDDLLAELIMPMDVQGAGQSDDLPSAATFDLRSEVRRFERALIDKAIRVHGSKRKAAKALGVDIGTVVRKTTETSTEEAIHLQPGDK